MGRSCKQFSGRQAYCSRYQVEITDPVIGSLRELGPGEMGGVSKSLPVAYVCLRSRLGWSVNQRTS